MLSPQHSVYTPLHHVPAALQSPLRVFFTNIGNVQLPQQFEMSSGISSVVLKASHPPLFTATTFGSLNHHLPPSSSLYGQLSLWQPLMVWIAVVEHSFVLHINAFLLLHSLPAAAKLQSAMPSQPFGSSQPNLQQLHNPPTYGLLLQRIIHSCIGIQLSLNWSLQSDSIRLKHSFSSL